MASWQSRLAAFFVRHRIKPALGDMHDIARVRAVFATRLPVPRGVRFTAGHLGGVPGEWVEAADPIAAGAARRLTVLYLHGGDFVGCSARTHRPLTASIALLGARLFVPDYRLAPEHPFPGAIEDVCAAWRALRVALPSQDPIAEWLKRRLLASLAYRLVRVKNVLLTMLFFNPPSAGYALHRGARSRPISSSPRPG